MSAQHDSSVAVADPWPRPTKAVEILSADAQHTNFSAWLATRREGVGASEIMAILGLLPWKTGFEVWLDKTHRGAPKTDNFFMERGRRLESAAAQWFADRTGLSMRRTGTWRSLAHPWAQCNPDRFVSDGGGFEAKVVADDWADLWADGPADFAAGQAHFCMAVTGLSHWWVAALMNSDFRFWKIKRDEDTCQRMLYAAWLWWHAHVRDERVHGVVCRPEVDGSLSTEETLKDRYRDVRGGFVEIPGLRERADERKRIKKEVSDAEKRLRAVENLIRADLEHARVGTDGGVPIIEWAPRTRVDVDREVVKELAPEAFYVNNYRAFKDLVK